MNNTKHDPAVGLSDSNAGLGDLKTRNLKLLAMVGLLAPALIHANERSVCSARPGGTYFETLTEYDAIRNTLQNQDTNHASADAPLSVGLASSFTDAELTEMYNKANSLDPKRHNPITTERIFKAMRECLNIGAARAANIQIKGLGGFSHSPS